jgi:uncharacterized protein (TIGR02117 family)
MKKILKYTGYTLLTLLSLILLYLIGAWALSRLPVRGESAQNPDITIYILGNGVHTDVVMPVKTGYKNWSESILYKNTRANDTALQYLAIGWGDKGFYLNTPTWADLKFSTAFNAAFGLSSAAIHATFYKGPLAEGKRCVKLSIDKEQYQRLVSFIDKSLQRDSLGQPILIVTKMRYNNDDAFYEAKGSYSLFHTCNTWTNNALKASGQRACWWTPFEEGIFYACRK